MLDGKTGVGIDVHHTFVNSGNVKNTGPETDATKHTCYPGAKVNHIHIYLETIILKC